MFCSMVIISNLIFNLLLFFFRLHNFLPVIIQIYTAQKSWRLLQKFSGLFFLFPLSYLIVSSLLAVFSSLSFSFYFFLLLLHIFLLFLLSPLSVKATKLGFPERRPIRSVYIWPKHSELISERDKLSLFLILLWEFHVISALYHLPFQLLPWPLLPLKFTSSFFFN